MITEVAREDLLQFMRDAAYKPTSFDDLCSVFKIDQDRVGDFREWLNRLESEGSIIRTRVGRYGVPERMNLVVGKLQGHEKGFGFVIPDYDDFEDMFISPDDMGTALHGDRVIARPYTRRRRGRKGRNWEGEIIRILERANKELVGMLDAGRHFGFVTPTDRRIFTDVFVPKQDYGGAKTGDLVLVEITRWPEKRRNPQGRVVERIGRPGEPGVDILSVIHNYHLPTEFPPRVVREVRDVPQSVNEAELEGRLDLRDVTMFTIDPPTARDFDDAVSLDHDEERNIWHLGVHIADVSHYVREGTALDDEARDRATSVYLVDRVIPMLPERLSNGICSLRPEVDRLTLSVFMDFDGSGDLVDHRIAPTVINSNARFTYDEVFELLTDPHSPLRDKYEPYVDRLMQMDTLRGILRHKRRSRGSLDFDFPEARVVLSKQGLPVDIVPESNDISHQLIEEFMIAANETIAEHFHWLQVPFLYRVHEEPADDKVDDFRAFIHAFGLQMKKPQDHLHPKVFQDVLDQVEGRPEEQLVNTVMLRSMKQARYAVENFGHFGLASKYYTHFTSPIRRYPDLMIHRIIKDHIASGGLSAKRTGQLIRVLPDVAEHCSERERVAEEAERETVDMKKVEYMKRHVGDVFDGLISGVTNFGLFVQLPNTVEGLVHVSTITDDYYHFHDEQYALVGERTGQRFRIGDGVTVQVMKVNVAERQVDFELVEEE